MSDLVKTEMRRRLDAIIQAATEIKELSLLGNFHSNAVNKQIGDIKMYAHRVELDLGALRLPPPRKGLVD